MRRTTPMGGQSRDPRRPATNAVPVVGSSNSRGTVNPAAAAAFAMGAPGQRAPPARPAVKTAEGYQLYDPPMARSSSVRVVSPQPTPDDSPSPPREITPPPPREYASPPPRQVASPPRQVATSPRRWSISSDESQSDPQPPTRPNPVRFDSNPRYMALRDPPKPAPPSQMASRTFRAASGPARASTKTKLSSPSSPPSSGYSSSLSRPFRFSMRDRENVNQDLQFRSQVDAAAEARRQLIAEADRQQRAEALRLLEEQARKKKEEDAAAKIKQEAEEKRQEEIKALAQDEYEKSQMREVYREARRQFEEGRDRQLNARAKQKQEEIEKEEKEKVGKQKQLELEKMRQNVKAQRIASNDEDTLERENSGSKGLLRSLTRRRTDSRTASGGIEPIQRSTSGLASIKTAQVPGSTLTGATASTSTSSSERFVHIECNKSSAFLPVKTNTTPTDLISTAALVMSESMDPSSSVLLESFSKIGVQRPLRSYEHVQDVMNSWEDDRQNSLIIVPSASNSDAAGLTLNNVPYEQPDELSTILHYSNKIGKWDKRWITLRTDGQVTMAKKDNLRDATDVCHMSDFDVYTPDLRIGLRRIRAPKKICFAIKSQQKASVFEPQDSYVHFFSTSDKQFAAKFYKTVQSWRSFYLVHVLDRGTDAGDDYMSANALQDPSGRPQPTQNDSSYQLGTFKPLLDFDNVFGEVDKAANDELNAVLNPTWVNPPKLNYGFASPSTSYTNYLNGTSSATDIDTSLHSTELAGGSYLGRQSEASESEKTSLTKDSLLTSSQAAGSLASNTDANSDLTEKDEPSFFLNRGLLDFITKDQGSKPKYEARSKDVAVQASFEEAK